MVDEDLQSDTSVPRAEIALAMTVLAFSVFSFVLWPWHMIFGVPILVAIALAAFGVLWVLKRFRLYSFWYSQLASAILTWPIALSEISLVDTATRMKWTQIGLIMLAFGHIGGAIVWFAGVYRTTNFLPRPISSPTPAFCACHSSC